LATQSRNIPSSTVCRRDMAALQHWAFYMAHRATGETSAGNGLFARYGALHLPP